MNEPHLTQTVTGKENEIATWQFTTRSDDHPDIQIMSLLSQVMERFQMNFGYALPATQAKAAIAEWFYARYKKPVDNPPSKA